MTERIKNRPILWLVATGVVALLLGIGIGGASSQEESSTSADGEESSLQAEVDRLEGELTDAESELGDAEDRLSETESRLASSQDEVDTLRGHLQQARQASTSGQGGDDQTSGDGARTVGDFRISDVQVREDSLGDFEIRARIENTGDTVDFADMEASVFSGDSVIATASSVESFDAGQTRTVTFISTDGYQDWDEVEFTIDTF